MIAAPVAVLVMPRIGTWDRLRSGPGLPLSLLHAASVAATRHRLAILDTRLVSDWRRALGDLVGPATRLVAVTSFSGSPIASALTVASYAKRVLGKATLWGGVHATLEPASTLAHPDVDYVLRGEGELGLAALLDGLVAGRTEDLEAPGLCLKLPDGSPRISGFELIEDLDSLPDLPYGLVDVDACLPRYRGRRSFYFQSSRGCPRHCTFCYNACANRARWRAWSAESALERLESAVSRFDVDDVYFVDDNFFVDRERARRIATWFLGRPLTWQLQGVEVSDLLELSNDELRLLAESGCQRVSIGVESGSNRVRRLLGKDGTADDVKAAVARLAPFDLRIYCSFLTGLPGETLDDVRATVALHEALPRVNANVRVSPIYNYVPYPGTPLFTRAVRDGFQPPIGLADWSEMRWERNVYDSGTGLDARFFEALHFASLFADDHKVDDYTDSAVIKGLARLYRPLAAHRMRSLRFGFMPELRLVRLLERLVTRT